MLTRQELFRTINDLRRTGTLSSYQENFQRYLSPIYKFPIHDYNIIAIPTKSIDITLLMMVFYVPETNNIKRINFCYYFRTFEYKPEIYGSIISGVMVDNRICRFYISESEYKNAYMLKKLVKKLLNTSHITYAVNSKDWDNLKPTRAEEHFDLLERLDNMQLKHR